ncbi:MAG: RluA family pseudouridine synthase [Desulfobacterales bacterium]
MDARHRQIRVLFENEELIAVDKPEGLASIPERNPENLSLLRLITDARGQKIFAVHRLDKQVSGVILFAKTPAAHRHLNLQFEQRKVHKTYLAFVHGTIEGDAGAIEIPLRRFGSGRMGPDQTHGKPCRSDFSVVERMPGYTLVRVSPLTGRKHQIRAHFFSLGHPVVGDPLYGEKAMQTLFPRLMLHAVRLEVRLPSGEEVSIESKLPQTFLTTLIEIERKHR